MIKFATSIYPFMPSLTLFPVDLQRENTDWIFYLVFFEVLLLAFIINRFGKQLWLTLRLPFNRNVLRQVMNDKNPTAIRSFFFAMILFFISTGLFIWRVFIEMFFGTAWLGAGYFLSVTGIVSAFYFVKLFLFRFSGSLFGTEKAVSEYVLTWNSLSILTAIILIPFNVSFVFCRLPITREIALAGLALVLSGYLYRLIHGFLSGLSHRTISPFYLFLYFCTLEILPFVILIKFFIEKFQPVIN